MGAQILDGKSISADLREHIKASVAERVAAGGRAPGLVVVLVGENPASQVYVRNKQKACEQVGFKSELIKLPKETTQADLFGLIDELNERDDVDGILVQLPLPEQIDEDAVTERILPTKDVDGFHPYNIGRLVLRQPILRPCTPKGVMTMLARTGIDLVGKDAVIIGQSNIVGRPMFLELLMARCTVTVCHSKTQDLPGKVRAADIVVAAVGVPNFVKADWVKPGAIVIDVGINRLDDGTLCGDVDTAPVSEVASWITPVPGGVGPMTIATLLENTLLAADTAETTHHRRKRQGSQPSQIKVHLSHVAHPVIEARYRPQSHRCVTTMTATPLTPPNYAPRVKHSDDKAQAYLERRPEKHRAEMQLIEAAFDSLPPIHTVLDAPCGVGRASIWLAQQGYQVTGVDLGEAALKVAAEQVKAAGVDVTIESQNVFDMTYEDRAFDAVLCFRLLHHFADPAQRHEMITEMCRVADRYVVMSYHSPWSIATVRRRIRNRMGGKPIVQHPASRGEMLAAFADNGFTLHHHSSWSPYLHSLQLGVFARS